MAIRSRPLANCDLQFAIQAFQIVLCSALRFAWTDSISVNTSCNRSAQVARLASSPSMPILRPQTTHDCAAPIHHESKSDVQYADWGKSAIRLRAVTASPRTVAACDSAASFAGKEFAMHLARIMPAHAPHGLHRAPCNR
jgi:hypothetical protein